MHFIGIDVGTSAVKAVLVDSRQRVIAASEVRLGLRSPHPGWSEQDPEDWWTATLAALAVLRTSGRAGWDRVASIGLSGQMHGAVVLDAHGVVLRPAILWNDGRSDAECRELEASVPGLGASPAPRRCPASRPQNCFGSGRTSRTCSRASRMSCCRRISSGSG